VRALSFVNSQGTTLVLDEYPYCINKIEGLGAPKINTYTQKAPYQNGETYISNDLQRREIVVDISISKGPNDFAEMETRRRELAHKFSPLYGEGELTYTNENGTNYKITAVVSALTFSNKDYRDPYVHAQITFTACEALWRKATSASVNLPTAKTETHIVSDTVFNYNNENISVKLCQDGVYRLITIRNPDRALVSFTSTDGLTWTFGTVIDSGTSGAPSFDEYCHNNIWGRFIVCYYDSNGDTVIRTTDDFITWTAKSTVTASQSTAPWISFDKYRGLFIVTYPKITTNVPTLRTASQAPGGGPVGWSAEVQVAGTVVAGSYVRSIVRNDASVLVYFTLNASGEVLRKTTSEDFVTWTALSAWYTASTGLAVSTQVFQNSNDSYILAYATGGVPAYYVRSYNGVTWSAASALTGNASTVGVAFLPLGLLFVLANGAGTAMYAYKHTYTTVTITNSGDASAPISVLIEHGNPNPRIGNDTSKKYIRVEYNLDEEMETMAIDTTFGEKSVIITRGIYATYDIKGMRYADPNSDFWELSPGDNLVYLDSDTVTDTVYDPAVLTWTERYVGV